MLSSVLDYLRGFWGNWVALMSGIASVVLAFWGAFFPPSDYGRRYLLLAAAGCFVMASFRVWLREHKDKIKLEQESGPQILIAITGIGINERFVFRNVGTETALNVEIEEDSDSDIKLHVIPWTISAVDVNAPQEAKLLAYRELGPRSTESCSLDEFLGGDKTRLRLAVVFENLRGTRYRRCFEMRRPLLSNEILCYSIGSRKAVTQR